MSSIFDPYHLWLGIPPSEHPLNHYRLLGIELFEQKLAVIEHAADQRMAHIRAMQTGPHSSVSQKILNELATARVCLLNPAKKAPYDQQLRAALAPKTPAVPEPPPVRRAAGPPVVQRTPPPPVVEETAAYVPTPGGAKRLATAAMPADSLGQLGEYQLLEKLGEGGMGKVYKALHTKLGREVALKVLSNDKLQDEQAIGRFEREMKAIGALDHPNIVRASDAREIDGTRFLVMELLVGFDLEKVVRRSAPLSIADACELIRQAALGLECAHQHGMVHRDIKPSNLMLVRGGQVKLLDLGLARLVQSQPIAAEMTATGQAIGTIDYMAPEQIEDTHSADIRADIYGLGCTLYKLLAGYAPFSFPEGQSVFEKMKGHLQKQPTPLKRFRDDVPKELASLVSRMLAKTPTGRPQTPAEVADGVASLAVGSDLPALLASTGQKPPMVQSNQAMVGTDGTQSSSMTRFFQGIGKQYLRSRATSGAPPWIKWSAMAGVALVGLLVILIIAKVATREEPQHSETAAGSQAKQQHGSLPPQPARPRLLMQWSANDRQNVKLFLDSQLLDLARPPVEVNNKQVAVPLQLGEHTVRIVRRGFKTFEQTFTLSENKDLLLSPHWEKEPTVVAPVEVETVAQTSEPPKTEPKPQPEPAQPDPEEEAEKPVVKVDPPSADEQKRLINDIDEVYKSKEAKDQAAKVALARKLLEDSRKNEANRAEQFVLLRRAAELARDAGEAELMLEAVDAMTAAGFNIRPFPVKARLLKQLVEQGTPGGVSQLSTVSASCVRFAEEAAASGAVKEASDVLDSAQESLVEPRRHAQMAWSSTRVAAMARARNPADKAAREKKAAEMQAELETVKSAQSALAECAKGLQQARREHEAIQAAQEKLKTAPDDPDACLEVGRWYCFYQGDWDEGLKLLAKGSDDVLKSLASAELASKPSKVEDRVARGDAWWDLAEKVDGNNAKAAMRRRAADWYQEAMPALSPGLGKSRVEQRLAQAAEEPSPEANGARTRPPLAVAPFNEKTAKQHQARWAKYLRVPVVQKNSIGMNLALIPPGEFQMGSPKELIEEEKLRLHGDDGGYADRLPGEGPQHRVRITKPYWLGVTEVTQEEYQRVMGSNPSSFQGDPKRPVDTVEWDDAVEFCRRLSELPGEKAAKRRYALPTEAQWEYACRAGSTGRWCFSAQRNSSPAVEENIVGEYAWISTNASGQTHPVGQKKPNGWDIYDMHGNVQEWCQDWKDKEYYAKNPPVNDPAGPSTGEEHVNRGGGFDLPASWCRSAFRLAGGHREGTNRKLGFRACLVPTDKRIAASGRNIPTFSGKQPPLAVAPFDKKTPKQHQARWAKYLIVPVVQTVGNKGNKADTTGFGAVPYEYKIGKYEVTNAEYCEFLNAVAKTDTHELYDERMDGGEQNWGGIKRNGKADSYTYVPREGMGKKPVGYVTWESCARYCNWLSNGRGNGDTEKGPYRFDGRTRPASPDHVKLAAAATTTWVIPSENEWYKAAYYDPKKPGGPGYWLYPVKGNTPPAANLNTNKPSEAGYYRESASPYGTYDQGGNAWEFNDSQSDGKVGLRGGSYYVNDNADYMRSTSRYDDFGSKWPHYGFRVSALGGN